MDLLYNLPNKPMKPRLRQEPSRPRPMPLPRRPEPEPERPSLYMPPPEEQYDPEKDKAWRDKRKDPDDPESAERGVWEWQMHGKE